jgi:hypothetical protein
MTTSCLARVKAVYRSVRPSRVAWEEREPPPVAVGGDIDDRRCHLACHETPPDQGVELVLLGREVRAQTLRRAQGGRGADHLVRLLGVPHLSGRARRRGWQELLPHCRTMNARAACASAATWVASVRM